MRDDFWGSSGPKHGSNEMQFVVANSSDLSFNKMLFVGCLLAVCWLFVGSNKMLFVAANSSGLSFNKMLFVAANSSGLSFNKMLFVGCLLAVCWLQQDAVCCCQQLRSELQQGAVCCCQQLRSELQQDAVCWLFVGSNKMQFVAANSSGLSFKLIA